MSLIKNHNMKEVNIKVLENTTGVFDLKANPEDPEIARKIERFNTIIKNNWSKIISIIEDKKLEHLYDIREKANNVINYKQDFFSPKEVDELQTIAYLSGVHIFSIYTLMENMITNKYFKEKNLPLPKEI